VSCEPTEQSLVAVLAWSPLPRRCAATHRVWPGMACPFPPTGR